MQRKENNSLVCILLFILSIFLHVVGKSKADRKARKQIKKELLEKSKQTAKENDCATQIHVNVGALEKPSVNMNDPDNVVFFETEWIKEKSIDVGDILDQVDCPEECGSFISLSFEMDSKYDTGKEEDDNAIDKAVQVVRRICKLLLEQQIFAAMPCYHSYSVMYDPDQSPRQVRLSIYLIGSDKEIRQAYGLPVMLSSIFSSFTAQGSMCPSSKTLFNQVSGGDIILANEFQMRSSMNVGFKRKKLTAILGKTVQALKNCYPYVGPYHAEQEALNLSETTNIVDLLTGAASGGGVEEGEETKDGTSKSRGSHSSEAAETAETEETQGGTGVMPWVRYVLETMANNSNYSTKQEFEIAIPDLSILLLPELPDCFQPLIAPKMRALLAHFVKGPGGMIDTVKKMWNSVVGEDWTWERFNKEYFALLDLLKHNETNKIDELIYQSHHTFRHVLTNVREIRIQCGDRGLKTEFKNFNISGFVPPGPSKSMIAEREKQRIEKLKSAGVRK